MQFRLPDKLAKDLQSYDESYRQLQNTKKAENRSSTLLKRKTKLAFPCPDIFFDLPLETVYGTYEFFCIRTQEARFMLIADDDEVARHLVTWEKDTDSKVDIWSVWKIVDVDCPIILRQWNSSMETDQFNEYRADQSRDDFKCATNKRFSRRYKKENDRAAQVNCFFDSVRDIVGDIPGSTRSAFFDRYVQRRYFYEENFQATKDAFLAEKWLKGGVNLSSIASTRNVEVLNKIAESKFYQKAVYDLAAFAHKDFIEYGNPAGETIARFKVKLQFIYFFLLIYQDEYDRSIHLFNQLSEMSIPTYVGSWYGVSRIFEYPNIHGEESAEGFLAWFKDKVTPQMFINWIIDQVQFIAENRWDSTISDTFRMLHEVYCARKYKHHQNVDFEKEPKRWRLMETHDHFSILSLQMNNELVNLPKDLIPEPVVFDTEVGTINMFQPSTNHEVIRWGKAVRNCVGSAGYDQRVLKRNAFLVFAERDGKPWLTSLLTVNMGMLHVGQSVSPSNKSLSQDETQVYHQCLQRVLRMRES